jgi:hypothetical protein
MKRIEVEERIFNQFEEYRGKEEHSRALGRLIRQSEHRAQVLAEKIAVVILEDHWFSFGDNPGQASNAPFLEGVCRLVNNLKSYRLNFYDSASFDCALEAVLTVPEQRIILYIAAHGSKCMIGAANSKNLMKKVAEFSRKRKVEGILLSSCMAGGHDPAMIEALKGGANWIFGYTSKVDFLGSVQVEAAILERLACAGPLDSENEEKTVEIFAKALNCFNPKWIIGSVPLPTLEQSIRLITRGKRMQNPVDKTAEVIKEAW